MVIDHLGLLLEEGVGLPLLSDVHKLVDDLFVLLVEQLHVFLGLEMHGVVAKPMHFADGVFVKHALGTLLSYLLESQQVPLVFELPLDLVEGFCLA